MKKLLYIFLALTIFACSDDEGNPCEYQPSIVTLNASEITDFTATLNGTINVESTNCDSPNNTEQGFVYSTTIQPTTNNIQVNVNGTDITTTLENLEPNTTYYVRTFLTNALGEFYGNEVSFITSEEQTCIYNLNTQDVTNITTMSAVLSGNISTEDIVNCELSNTEQGFVYSTAIQPTTNNIQVNVNGTDITTTLENLELNTTYYVRTFLTNDLGEFYGNEVSFITSEEEEPFDCNVVYLADNGITVKACEQTDVGATGIIDGVTYTVVDEQMLRVMVNNEEDITKLATTKVTDMSSMFQSEPTLDINQDISNWDVSNVTDMRYMFSEAYAFNQPLGNWDVSNVTDMSYMFFCGNNSPFNQDLSDWDVSNVTDMRSMFFGASNFNQPIGDWDVSSVANMEYMFLNANTFNQPIGDWDVINVTDMDYILRNAISFNQDLSVWTVDNVVSCSSFSLNTPQWTLPKPNFTNCNPD